MSPYPGEAALPLWFGVLCATLGAMIALYVIYRVVSDRRARDRVNADRPEPHRFHDYPELQALIDHMYLARFEARRAAQASLGVEERDALAERLDALIERGL